MKLPIATADLPLGPPPAAPAQPDDWPYTTRLLPWLIAGFMAMVFIVPFDSTQLPVTLPFDLKLDRIAVAAIAIVWVAAVVAGGPDAPRFRRSPVNLALGAFTAVAVASVLLNLQPLANAGELSLALKRLVLLGAFLTFFFIVATAIRPGEVRAFMVLLAGLGLVTAIGVIYEYRSGTNPFFTLSNTLLPGYVTDPTPQGTAADFDQTGRRTITGPAAHGLALTTMLAMVVPVAVLALMRARELGPKLLYGAITAILLAGSISTVRKSAAIVPVVGFVVLALYRPRAMVRLTPFLLAMVVLVHFMSPGAMGSIKSQFFPKDGFYNSPSVRGRTEDKKAVQPDLKNHPIIGRGYGTYDPVKYRLLDNQYIGLRITTGWFGYSTYLLLLLSIALVGHRLARTRDPSRAPPALVAVAAAAIVAAASQLFDTLAFAQVPYILLFLGALAVALSRGRHPPSHAAPARVPQKPSLPQEPRPAGAFAGAPRG